jgi:hypothetical protein
MATNIVWTYVDAMGVEAPAKNVALTYIDGVFKSFTDNWQFYTIAGVPNLSKEQALDLALNTTSEFSYIAKDSSGVEVNVSNVKVASVGESVLCYLNFRDSASARNGDPFTLFPSWYIPLGFDQVYPGSVTGSYVRIWADNGQLSIVSPMVCTAPGTSENTTTITGTNLATCLMVVSIPIIVAVGAALFYLNGCRPQCLLVLYVLFWWLVWVWCLLQKWMRLLLGRRARLFMVHCMSSFAILLLLMVNR